MTTPQRLRRAGLAAAAVVPEALESVAAAPIATPLPPITSAAAVARPARRTRCAVVIASRSSIGWLMALAKPGAAQARWRRDGDDVEER